MEGSGVLGELTPPISLTLGDVLTLMVVLSDNTATNMAIDRLGLAHNNATLRAAGVGQTMLYKKVYVPATSPMPPGQPRFGLGKTTPREMAAIMERFATCRLDLDGSAPHAGDGPICGAILHMLRNQQDRDSLPRLIESMDTSEHGSAIGNKTGALDQVRNDVALISTKNGPVVISAFPPLIMRISAGTATTRQSRPWAGSLKRSSISGRPVASIPTPLLGQPARTRSGTKAVAIYLHNKTPP